MKIFSNLKNKKHFNLIFFNYNFKTNNYFLKYKICIKKINR